MMSPKKRLSGKQLDAIQIAGTGPKLTEPLAKSSIVGYPRSMIITADARRRVTLPKPAHPGDVFHLEATGPGQFLLTRLEKPARKVTLSRENGFLVAHIRQAHHDRTRPQIDGSISSNDEVLEAVFEPS